MAQLGRALGLGPSSQEIEAPRPHAYIWEHCNHSQMFDRKGYDIVYYKKNRAKILRQKIVYKKELRIWYDNLKVGCKCRICGEGDPRCLDYHHIDPKTKLMTCADFFRMNCKKKLIEEIKKCELLCANCHRKL